MKMALEPNPVEGHNGTVVVGIDKDRHSQYAVKWAVDNIAIKERRCLVVVHVRTHGLLSYPSSDARTGRAPTEVEMDRFFLPYRGYCAHKGIDAKEVVLHDLEVSSALAEYTTSNHISCIVVGTSSHNALTRKFRAADVPTSLAKSVPDYCTVYAVGRYRAHCIHKPSGRSYDSIHCSSASSGSSSTTTLSHFLQYSPTSETPRDSSSNFLHFLFMVELQKVGVSYSLGLLSLHLSNQDFHWQQPPCLPGQGQSEDGDEHEGEEMGSPEREAVSTHPSKKGSLKLPKVNKSSLLARSSSAPENNSKNSILECNKIREGSKPSMKPRGYSRSRGLRWSRSSVEFFNSDSTESNDFETELERLKRESRQKKEALQSLCNEEDAAEQMVNTLEEGKQAKEEVAHTSRQQEGVQTNTVKLQKANCEEDEKKAAKNKWAGNMMQYKRYTLEEIEKATNYFSASLKIGEGGYGTVYNGVIDNSPVAIKVLRPDVSQGLKQFQKEIEVLSQMKHPNMVRLIGACPEYGCLVYEYMDNGSLEDRLQRKDNTPPIPWRTRFKIATEIATALFFLHSKKPEPIVHRDLKPANVLLDRDLNSKICDVGLARLIPSPSSNSVTQGYETAAAGTLFYIDPEYQQTGLLSVESDLYSLGVVFLQLITGRAPMGLIYAVQTAIEEGKFAEILDPSLNDWPVEGVLPFAQMALKCCELRKKDRPDLGLEVSTVLIHLNAYAISDASTSASSTSLE